MRVVIAWWDLAGTGRTVASLRDFLRDEAVDTWSQVRGLLLKTWISDDTDGHERWGAVFLWESAEAAAQELPRRAAELLGGPPHHLWSFDVEATVEGVHDLARLAGHGRALLPGRSPDIA
ncbi:hypothetical protein [Streptomyces sp. UNOC14_S4]|uniref:hypothetical protein n=1 Tax=Streptomyces sp. UNOC14_S4 TaxID=2872340 RepID=UPI001E30A069|nr:hypothetical protein [Streptomyces sp. UNOC14_S4]MCC3767949.1 hypothetical protein [Streptomyces sp. UNOC14_S4]